MDKALKTRDTTAAGKRVNFWRESDEGMENERDRKRARSPDRGRQNRGETLWSDSREANEGAYKRNRAEDCDGESSRHKANDARGQGETSISRDARKSGDWLDGTVTAPFSLSFKE